MNSLFVIQVLLGVIGFGLALGIRLLVNISKKVNSMDVMLNVIVVKQQAVEKEMDRHSVVIDKLKLK